MSASTQRYSLPAIVLHWLQAAIVVWLLWLGWTMVDLPKGPVRNATYELHKSLGLLTFLILIVRLLWRSGHPAPALNIEGWEARMAKFTHHALYAFLLLAPLAGYLTSSFTPYAVKFFGVAIPSMGWPDKTLNGIFKEVHELVAWAGAGLIILHVLGTVKHGLKGERVLGRMLPVWLSRN